MEEISYFDEESGEWIMLATGQGILEFLKSKNWFEEVN